MADAVTDLVELDETAAEALDLASIANTGIFMLQTVQSHHVALSQMADQKANIVIAAASVVFALVVSKGEISALPPSLIILAVSAFASAALCIFAVMPSIGHVPQSAHPNLLFFGAFVEVPETEWHRKMTHILATNRRMHDAMLHDIHQMGCVLKHKKYKYLAYGYRVFLGGLALTLLAFAAEQVVR